MDFILTSVTCDISDHINLSIIEGLWELQQGGGPDILIRVIDTFLRTGPDLLTNIQTAIETNDPAALQMAAHSMKSSNGQIGALHLMAMCHELEMLGASETTLNGATLFTKLEDEWQKVELALACILGQLRTS